MAEQRVRSVKGRDRRNRSLAPAVERRKPTGRDRRKHERVVVNFEVDYSSTETFLFAYITDLSVMGIFIQTRAPETPGTHLNLRFRTPAGERMELEGQVIWVNPYRPGDPEGNPGMGIQFVRATPVQKERLTQLVRTFAYLDDEDGNPKGVT